MARGGPQQAMKTLLGRRTESVTWGASSLERPANTLFHQLAKTAAMSVLSALLISLASAQTRVSIETEAGIIKAILDDQKAPITVANVGDLARSIILLEASGSRQDISYGGA